MNEGSEQLIRDVKFAREVEDFLCSSVGRYLCSKAEAEIASAVESLKQVDPDDAKAIRLLQNRIWRAENIQYWLADAITQGDVALAQLEDRG